MGAYCTVNYCSSRGPLFVWVWVFVQGFTEPELSLLHTWSKAKGSTLHNKYTVYVGSVIMLQSQVYYANLQVEQVKQN
jgi:hypothetical protein